MKYISFHIMDSDPQYLSDKTSSFEDFKITTEKVVTNLCIVLAAIISANYLYLMVTGKIHLKFNIFFLIISISTQLLAFIMSLIIFHENKGILKLIGKTDWKKWSSKGKYRFAFTIAFRFLCYAIVLLAIGNYFFGLLREQDLSSDGTTILSTLVPGFLTGLSIAINAWNIKMKERNTLRDRLFSTRLH
jgi:hypothetical protein